MSNRKQALKTETSVINSFNKVDDFVGAMSGDAFSVASLASNHLKNGGLKDAIKGTTDCLGTVTTVAKAIGGDPMAQLQLAVKIIGFLTEPVSNKKINIPKTAKLNLTKRVPKNITSENPKSDKKPKPKPKNPISANNKSSNNIKEVKIFDVNKKPDLIPKDYSTVNTDYDFKNSELDIDSINIDEVEDFTSNELISLEDFPVEFDGIPFEELEKLIIDFNEKISDQFVQDRISAAEKLRDTDKKTVIDQFQKLIDGLYSGENDPTGEILTVVTEIENLKQFKQSKLDEFHTLIGNIFSEMSDYSSQINYVKASIDSKKCEKACADKESKFFVQQQISALFDSKNELYSLKNLCNDQVENYKQEKDAFKESIQIDIQALYDNKKLIQQRIKELYIEQKMQQIAKINNTFYENKKAVIDTRKFAFSGIKKIKSTIVKSKLCEWKYCTQDGVEGKPQSFNLSYSTLAFFKSKGFEEQVACQCCIDYKNRINELSKSNQLILTCKGIIDDSDPANVTQKVCKHNSIKELEACQAIGIPKLIGNIPLKFDGTDDYQCKKCKDKKSDNSIFQVPFINLPIRAQELIDNYLDMHSVNPYIEDEEQDVNLPRLLGRFYYSVMYQILRGGNGTNYITNNPTITSEANSASYDASYYELTPHSPGNQESAALHLLKHMLNLGEKYNHGWSSGITPDSHDQSQLRSILNLNTFVNDNNFYTNSTFPRQKNGIVNHIGYPSVLDTLTDEAKSYLQQGLDMYKQVHTNLGEFDLVTNKNGQKAAMSPFTEHKIVYRNGKITTGYYMDENTVQKHNDVFKNLVTTHLQAWKNDALALYPDVGETEDAYKFIISMCNEMVKYPNDTWKDPTNAPWNL